MKFEGLFAPPKMGNLHVPIPVAGPGFIEASPEQLVVSGFASPAGKSGLIALAVVALIIGGGIFSGGFLPQWVSVGILVAITSAIVGVGLKGSGKHKEDKPMLLNIPWDKIKKIEVDPNQTEMVLIIVKRFKPKGAIYFKPQASPKKVCTELFEFLPR